MTFQHNNEIYYEIGVPWTCYGLYYIILLIKIVDVLFKYDQINNNIKNNNNYKKENKKNNNNKKEN